MAEWFKSWFDCSYYHMLYDKRDENEASTFLEKLANKLSFNENLKVLDLACGKGRHSIALNKLGMNVVGLDLSSASIEFAKKHENESLKFFVHDMRLAFPEAEFDIVFNLFTSFGYFQNIEENIQVLQNIHQSLNQDGLLIIDFMNAIKVKNNLIESETIIKNNCEFHINRKIDNGKIIKTILVKDGNRTLQFEESVQAFSLNQFTDLFFKSNFLLEHVFGDYNLSNFAENSSPRLIMVCRKL